MSNTDLYQVVEKFWEKHILPASRICVAVSGGADSVALLHVLLDMKDTLQIAKLGVAHVNHALRAAESDSDAVFVQNLATKAKIPFHEKVLSAQNVPQSGIEAWARNERYGYFSFVKYEFGYDFVATAHTADDQAETVLMRIMRGSGTRGLCGIAPVRNDGIIRPLLYVKKQMLKEYIALSGNSFREDSSNKDTKFTRNRIRHDILPKLIKKDPAIIDSLTTLAEESQVFTRMLQQAIKFWIETHVFIDKDEMMVIEKQGLTEEYIASESIAELLREKKIEFDRSHIAAFFKSYSQSGKTFLLPGGWKYRTHQENVIFVKKQNGDPHVMVATTIMIPGETMCPDNCGSFNVEIINQEKKVPLDFSNPLIAYVDVNKIESILVYRSLQVNETFWPYNGNKNTKVNEFLKKQGIGLWERNEMKVLGVPNGDIAWVVGVRVDHRFRITPQTVSILKISYKHAP